jgi:hypothetical protein
MASREKEPPRHVKTSHFPLRHRSADDSLLPEITDDDIGRPRRFDGMSFLDCRDEPMLFMPSWFRAEFKDYLAKFVLKAINKEDTSESFK